MGTHGGTQHQPGRDMLHSHPLMSGRHALAVLALTLLAVPLTQAQAQSAYTLSVLNPGTANKPLGSMLHIDAQNRVFGSATYFTGYRWEALDLLGGLRIPSANFVYYPSRWSASTAASVSPTKIGSAGANVLSVSPSGSKWVSRVDGVPTKAIVVETATGKQQALLASSTGDPISTYADGPAVGINDAGWVVGHITTMPLKVPLLQRANDQAVLWKPGARGTILPIGNEYIGAQARFINASGMVVGLVYDPLTDNPRTAVWSNGVAKVLDARPGRGSDPRALNNAGQILNCSYDVEYKHVDDPYSSYAGLTAIYGNGGCEVVLNGVATPIEATKPGHVAAPVAMNASGTVLGVEFDPTVVENYLAPTSRAFLWKNGVMQDLSDLVKARGVKLMAGVWLSSALAINDQGSIVASYIDPSAKKQVFVRLQAKP